ncbi:MAG: hypothetical protein SOI26_03435 [Coriobacteriales bacterium]|jgi:hypothetical protein
MAFLQKNDTAEGSGDPSPLDAPTDTHAGPGGAPGAGSEAPGDAAGKAAPQGVGAGARRAGRAAGRAPSGPRDLVRSQLIICGVAAALIVAVIVIARALSGSASPVSRQQIESKLDYLVGSTAVTAYDSLDGYPVTFMMPDDGNPLGTWSADQAGSSGSDASASTGDGAAASSGATKMIDVTYQVQVAANNDYALDDARYTVTGYSSPDEMTGQITVYVVERFRQYEQALSQTLSIDSVAGALSNYGRQHYPEGFELLTVEATSVEAESGTWLVEGTARVGATADGTDEAGGARASSGADGAAPAGATGSSGSEGPDGTEGDGSGAAQTVEFSAQVTGTDESPQVTSFNVIG